MKIQYNLVINKDSTKLLLTFRKDLEKNQTETFEKIDLKNLRNFLLTANFEKEKWLRF